ncbi:MAG: SGNH/GDSL hydrolase family protein [archaeon]
MKQKISGKKTASSKHLLVDYFKKIALVLTSIIFTLVILEIVLTVSYPLWSDYNSEMWRYASELKKLSDTPDVGHEHIPNLSIVLYGAEIRTNSLGLRADREYVVPKPNSTRRILVLGDSITMGWGVNYSDTYAQVLESMLNEDKTAYEVINAGVGNYNTQNEYGTLKKYIDLDPDIIILGFYINDIEETKYSRLNYITKNSNLYALMLDKFIVVEYSGQKNYREIYRNLYENQILRNHLRNSIAEIIELSKIRKIPLIIVNIPEFHEFDNYPFSNVNILIKEAAEEALYVDMLPIFNQTGITPTEFWVSSEDPHPNALAHKLIAEELYKKIIQLDK